MATEKIIGMPDTTPDSQWAGVYQFVCRFQAEATGTMTEFRAKAYGNGTISYAVYDDDSGSPKNRLAQQATPQAVIEGWNTLAIDPVSVVSGAYYWLAMYQASGGIYYNNSGVARKYKAGASTFADPFDNSGFSDDNSPVFVAGWGVLVLSPSGISQPVAIGEPEVQQQSAAQTITPSGIAQGISVGEPIVKITWLEIPDINVIYNLLRYIEGIGDLEALVAIIENHSNRHENGGADEISLAGLSGVPDECWDKADSIQLADGKSVIFDPAPSADNLSAGHNLAPEQVGEGVTTFQILYFKSDGKWWKAKGDAAATMPCRAIALGTGDAEDFILIAKCHCYCRDDAWTWTAAKQPLFVSEATAGAMTETCPTGSGEQMQYVAFTKSATVIEFEPSKEWYEHA